MSFIIKPARTLEELQAVHDLAVFYFGEDVSSVKSMQQWQQHAGDMFIQVCSTDDDALIGYIALIPLTDMGEADLISGAVTGATLTLNHVPQGWAHAQSAYLGAIVGVTPMAKRIVKDMFNQQIETLSDQYSLKRVYARAGTEAGEGWITQKMQAQAVPNTKRLYVITL